MTSSLTTPNKLLPTFSLPGAEVPPKNSSLTTVTDAPTETSPKQTEFDQLVKEDDAKFIRSMLAIVLNSTPLQDAKLSTWLDSPDFQMRPLLSQSPEELNATLNIVLEELSTHPEILSSPQGQRFISTILTQIQLVVELNPEKHYLSPSTITALWDAWTHSRPCTAITWPLEQLISKSFQRSVVKTNPINLASLLKIPQTLSRYWGSINMDTKLLAIEVSRMIEGAEMRPNGIRLRVHQTGVNITAAIHAPMRDFLSGERRFIFKNDCQAPVPATNYKEVMLYIINDLKKRTYYYKNNPQYFNRELFNAYVEHIEEKGFHPFYLQGNSNLEKFSVEWVAQRVIALEEEVLVASSDAEIYQVLDKFREYWRSLNPTPEVLFPSTYIDYGTMYPSSSTKPVMVTGLPKKLRKLYEFFRSDHVLAQEPLVQFARVISETRHCPPETVVLIQKYREMLQQLGLSKSWKERAILAEKAFNLSKSLPTELSSILNKHRIVLDLLAGMPEPYQQAIQNRFRAIENKRKRRLCTDQSRRKKKTEPTKQDKDVFEAIEIFKAEHPILHASYASLGSNACAQQMPTLLVDFQALTAKFPEQAKSRQWIEFEKQLRVALEFLSVFQQDSSPLLRVLLGHPSTLDNEELEIIGANLDALQAPLVNALAPEGSLGADSSSNFYSESDYSESDEVFSARDCKFRGIFDRHLALLKEPLSKTDSSAAGPDSSSTFPSPVSIFQEERELERIALEKVRDGRVELKGLVTNLAQFLKQGEQVDHFSYDVATQFRNVLRTCTELRDYVIRELIPLYVQRKQNNNLERAEKLSTLINKNLQFLYQLEDAVAAQAVASGSHFGKENLLSLLTDLAYARGYIKYSLLGKGDIDLPKKLDRADSLESALIEFRDARVSTLRGNLESLINSQALMDHLTAHGKTADSWYHNSMLPLHCGALEALDRGISYHHSYNTKYCEWSESRIAVGGRSTQSKQVLGRLRICEGEGELSECIPGEILVIPHAVPDIHKFRHTAAIICVEGGIFSHAAIHFKELGIPAVLGTRNTSELAALDGALVSLELDCASKGNTVYKLDEQGLEVAESILQMQTPSIDAAAAILESITTIKHNPQLVTVLSKHCLEALLQQVNAPELLAGLLERGALKPEKLKATLLCRQSSRQTATKRLWSGPGPLEARYLSSKLRKEIDKDLRIAESCKDELAPSLSAQLRKLEEQAPVEVVVIRPLTGKADNLHVVRELIAHTELSGATEFYVPNFIKISKEEAKAFFAQTLDGKVLDISILRVLEAKELDAEAKSQAISQLMAKAMVSDAILSSVFRNASIQVDDTLIVRSSSALEDQTTSAAAGLFDSIENVKGEEAMRAALKEVWASAFSTRAIAYFEEKKSQDWSQLLNMDIIIQRYVEDAKYSGVLFSVAKEDNWDLCGMQCVEGLGGGVDGKATPTLAFTDSSRQVITELHQTKPGLPIQSDQIKDLSALVKSFEKRLGQPVEIEFCGSGERIAIVQLRPITIYTEAT